MGEIIFNTEFKVPQYCDDTNWIAMTGGQAPQGVYELNAVTFDGTNDGVSIDGTSMGTSTRLTFSLWAKMNDLSTFYRVFNDNGDRTQIFINDDETVAVFVRDVSNSGVFQCQTDTTTINDTTDWHHWMFSMDAATGDFHFYVDGVDESPGWCSFLSSNAYYPNTNFRLGTDNYGGFLDADIADVWFDVGTYIDFSSATNRELFYNAGEAVYLGADGSLPTGSAPDLFLSGPTGSWHANKGSAGATTEIGALTTAPSAPISSSTLEPTGTEVVPSGLLGHWRLDETTGTDALDSSGNVYNGIYYNMASGAATGTSEGVVATSMAFDGSDDYMRVSTTFDLAEFTVCGWFMPDEGADDNALISKFEDTSNGWWVEYVDGELLVKDDIGSPGSDDPLYQTAIPQTQWTHFCAGINSNPNNFLYINGTLIGDSDTPSGSWDSITSDRIYIAQRGNGSKYVDGRLDDIRLYNRALTASEVQQVYAARDGFRFNEKTRAPEYFDGNGWDSMRMGFAEVPYGLVGHWRMDETSGTTVTDASANSNNGTMQGSMSAASDSAVGAVKTSLSFDGVDDRISVADNAALEMTDDFSVSFWVKQDVNTGAKQKVMMKRHTVEPYLSWEFFIGASNEMAFQLANTASNSGVGTSYFYVGSNPLTEGRWYHVVGVKDGGELTLYLNGAEEEWYANEPYTGTIVDTDNDLLMGATTSSSEFFMGALDDVRIYTRALTFADVQDLYAMGAPIGQNTSLPQGCPNIGDACDDGTIYAGLSPDGNVPMFTTPQDGVQNLSWNDANNSGQVLTSASDSDAGFSNTTSIVVTDADSSSGGHQIHEASQHCYDSIIAGVDDWYLPAINELSVLYANREAIGGFITDPGEWYRRYHSSTEYSQTEMYIGDFSNGNMLGYSLKEVGYSTRCVRKGPAPRCANPYGVEGQMIFNSDHAVMQYCDGARWLAIGKAN